VIAYVALGSNLGERPALLLAALKAINALPDCRIIACSSVFESPPWGDTEQPAYLNAVASLETTLDPHTLLAALLAIEAKLGRERDPLRRFAPRTIDLDILSYANLRISTETLTLPHPRAHERRFVIEPLAEIAADHPLLRAETLNDPIIKKVAEPFDLG